MSRAKLVFAALSLIAILASVFFAIRAMSPAVPAALPADVCSVRVSPPDVRSPHAAESSSGNSDGSRGVAKAQLPTLPISKHRSQRDSKLAIGLDPGSVGWTSEAFNDSSLAQLKVLAKVLQVQAVDSNEQVSDEQISKVLTDDFVSSELRPKQLDLRSEDESSITRKWRQRESDPLPPLTYKRSQLAGLAAALPKKTSSRHRVALKNVEVELADAVRTRVYASGFGTTANQPTEWTATWDCTWSSHETPPRLTSLRVVAYEEVASKSGDAPFLIDRTATVMAQAEGYHEQLLLGMNTWVNRLEHRLRVNRLGHNGIAVGDANGDGREDVYVCQTGGLPNRLYVQQQNGSVVDISKDAGVNFLDDTTCALFVDLDNDGDQDLALVTVAAAVVMANDGTGRFTPQAIISECRNSFSLTAVDYNNDRLLDLYVGRYWASDATRGEHPLPIPYYDANNGGRNILLQNQGRWRFTDVTEAVGLDVNNSRFTMAAAWEDLDSDGDADLYVANDFGRNCWYRNENGKFVDAASEANVEDIASGMSVSFADFNHDGQFDIYVSNMFSTAGQRTTTQPQYRKTFPSNDLSKLRRLARGNTLFSKNRDLSFTDVSLDANVNMGRWAWGSLFSDINNDSWDDLLVANGFLTTSDTGDM